MAVRFNWNRLDITAAETLRLAVNTKLAELLNPPLADVSVDSTPSGRESANTAATQVGIKLSEFLQKVEVAEFDWGDVPPFVELQEVGPALDLSSEVVSLREEPRRGQSDHFDDDTASQQSTSSTLVSQALQSTTMEPIADDRLAQYIGPSGLYILFNLTYGGNMRVRLECEVRHRISLSKSCGIVMKVPMAFDVSNVKLDFSVNVNLHQNVMNLWLSEGAVSDLALQRISIDSKIGPPDAEFPPCCDRTAIAQLILGELQAVIRNRVMAPHYMTVPLFRPPAAV